MVQSNPFFPVVPFIDNILTYDISVKLGIWKQDQDI